MLQLLGGGAPRPGATTAAAATGAHLGLAEDARAAAASAPRRGRGGGAARGASCHPHRSVAVRRAVAAAVARRQGGQLLDARTIPKFVTPLVIPPVMNEDGHNSYKIALRKFKQQILPGGHLNSPSWGILDQKLPPHRTYSATTVLGYGPAKDGPPDSSSLPGGAWGVAPAPNSQFNYPGYTIENVKNVRTTVRWINHLVQDPWKCKWWEPRGPACNYIPHIVPVDQSLHWANPGKIPCEEGARSETDCRPADQQDPKLAEPYMGPVPMVVHVHGTHAKPHSDGYPNAWWLPAASNLKGFVERGSLVNKLGSETNREPGMACFEYENDQPSTTLWYHDHTLGITRANVYAGGAGFWLIREKDGGETGLVSGRLPGPAPRPGEGLEETNFLPGRRKYKEIPIAITDRSFYENGELFYPASRAFFQEVGDIPLVGDPTEPSDIAAIWNPEVFLDVMVVNGVSWPVHQVERHLYRFRLLNACGSRFLNLKLCTVPESGARCDLDENGKPQNEVDFFMIGSEQSLLPRVVQVSTGFKTPLRGDGTLPRKKQPTASPRECLLLGPAERADVLVDFSKLEPGAVVRLLNTGPDEPFGGFDVDDYEMADEETTRQVMEFHVLADSRDSERATAPEDLQLRLPDRHDPANQAVVRGKVRDLALLEEDSALICATTLVDGTVKWDEDAVPDPANPGQCVAKTPGGPEPSSVPFGPRAALLGIRGSTVSPVPLMWSDPITERPRKGFTELWDFWNWSEDAHTIHLHLVKFRVVRRTYFDTSNAKLGLPLPRVPTEDGWKDTVIAYPGQVTQVAATFDIAGLYVWHCHILEHEDNEMMRPYCVESEGGAPGCGEVP